MAEKKERKPRLRVSKVKAAPKTPWGSPANPKLWEARTSYGAKNRTSVVRFTPEELWLACVEYFEWIEANPLKEAKLVSYKGDSTLEYVPKMRAMTMFSLYIFLDITIDTWKSYTTRPGYEEVTQLVESIIRDQKFTAAAADLLNANLIARDLGLAERTVSDATVNLKDDRSPEEIAAGIESKLAGIAARRDKT